MLPEFSPTATKRSANLTINSDLLGQARELEINLSAVLEQALAQEVRVRRQQRWLESNRDAMEAYNHQVDEHGTFSDALRSF
ncbi:MAG: type II toxin-antitoxin system CcdA family antitoxin [Rhodocyclaceae bacterium]|jgi:antitoxin CcdA|nr:type II toxin-antitoxin system CcdA family antitoxin [Rhodocyclaceae bacterium]MCL4759144.1 type II toxin-antitoxin system CcdA family antitoxin [Rhodocyclaceae bacterium]